jgi:hypothetical protein
MLHRTIRWRPLEGAGLEHCEITETAEGITVRGMIIGDREGRAYGARYELRLDPTWVFRIIHIERVDGATLSLSSDGKGSWIDGENRHMAALSSCIDIDLSGSPVTNTLPIRRARLTPGMPQRFTMAWIPLDTLEPFPDEQIYTKLDERLYLFESGDGSFKAELAVDADGFVAHYPTLFEQL